MICDSERRRAKAMDMEGKGPCRRGVGRGVGRRAVGSLIHAVTATLAAGSTASGCASRALSHRVG